MSMVGMFHLVDELTWRRLLADPSIVDALVDEAYEQHGAHSVDVEKAWHALHYLLTGTAWEGTPPLDFIVCGGVELGEDQGYGPPRGFAPDEVARLAAALEPIGVDTLVARFDGPRMDELEIYPAGGWADFDPSDPERFGYVSGAFEQLKALLRRGRDEHHALLVWLC
jgi:hypothetical protein